MKTKTEMRVEKSEKLFKDLYYQGESINTIKEIANNLISIGDRVANDKSISIGDLSNGHLKIN